MTGPAARPVPEPTPTAPDPPPDPTTDPPPDRTTAAAADPEAPAWLDVDDETPPWPDEPVAGPPVAEPASDRAANAARSAAAERLPAGGPDPAPASARAALAVLESVFPGRVVRFAPAAAGGDRADARDDDGEPPPLVGGEPDALDDSPDGGQT